jgi:mycofactocin precursor
LDQEKEGQRQYQEKKEEDIFFVEEIKIEELAIDGICGVY